MINSVLDNFHTHTHSHIHIHIHIDSLTHSKEFVDCDLFDGSEKSTRKAGSNRLRAIISRNIRVHNISTESCSFHSRDQK